MNISEVKQEYQLQEWSGMLRADGRPNENMYGLLIGCVTNLILDPLFIFVFDMGVAGAAWATVIGQLLNAVYFVWRMFRFKIFKLKKAHFVPKLPVCSFDRVKQTYKLAMVTSTIFLTAALAVFQIFPEPIINLFGQESELYMQYAVKCFRIYLLGTFMVGVNAVTGVFFQSIGKSIQSALLSLSRQIILLVPGLMILGTLTGVEGLLWAGPISDIVAGVLSLIMVKVYWRSIFPNEG